MMYALQMLMVNMLLGNQFMVKKNHSLPFIAIAVAVGMVVYEGHANVELDIQTIMPLLVAVGVGGAVKKTVEKAFAAKATLPKSFKDAVKAEVEKLTPKTSPKT